MAYLSIKDGVPIWKMSISYQISLLSWESTHSLSNRLAWNQLNLFTCCVHTSVNKRLKLNYSSIIPITTTKVKLFSRIVVNDCQETYLANVGLYKRKLTWGKHHCMADILFILFGFSWFAFVEIKQFYLFSQIKPVNEEVSRTVPLLPMAIVLWLWFRSIKCNAGESHLEVTRAIKRALK